MFSTELAVIPTRSMIRASRVSSNKSLDMQKCFVSVAKLIVALINRLTSTMSAAKDSIKKHSKIVAMDQCQSTAKCWRRHSTLLHPIENFERFSIVLLRMNEQTKDSLTFVQKE